MNPHDLNADEGVLLGKDAKKSLYYVGWKAFVEHFTCVHGYRIYVLAVDFNSGIRGIAILNDDTTDVRSLEGVSDLEVFEGFERDCLN